MPNKMLIDSTHPEETRVVVVRGNRVEEFDFESAQRKQLRGNIYLAKVTRVEPSLQAAFIEYGGNRHGFLAFSEIHPDYYQIPVADRQALIEAEERAHREAEEESENRSSRRRSRHRSSRRRNNGERVQSEIVQDAASEAAQNEQPAAGDHDADFAHDHTDEHTPVAHDSDDHAHEAAEHDHHDHDEQDHGHETPAGDEPQQIEDSIPAAVTAAEQEAPIAASDDADHDDDHHDAAEHDEDGEAEHHAADDQSDDGDDHDDGEEDAEEDQVESVGGDDVLEEVPERTYRPRRQYKIQEVIKRRQVMLVQVVKEERGNKGAALTTYLSLAGRYAVLMPNTARGGGISRKITSAQDRNRLKDVVQDLDVPEGMGIILRTAGASRTKPEIKRDFEYLIRMWETVRDLTLKSQAPTLVYEEGSLIKRSLRDLYNKEIDEVLVAGEAGYHEARDFMKMLMPSSVRAVKQYRDGQPLFSRMGVESQLDAMFSPTVTLRSGGYIVINQTEALVSIDVNSGRSTREHHIEDTALKTNLEAAEEVARQLRLRDLAGLIVIDFIDMDEKRNNRAVERKLSDCLRQDRARIQIGRISHFGLLEMSRQRIRASVLESSTEPCPHCGGTGHVRSVASVALQLLRGIEETLMKGPTHNLSVRTRTDVALYVLNHKRGHLRDLENAFKVSLAVIADPTVSGQQSFVIDRGEAVHTLEAAKAILAAQVAAAPIPSDDSDVADEEVFEDETSLENEDAEEGSAGQSLRGEDDDGEEAPRRRRRRRRRGRGSEAREAGNGEQTAASVAEESAAADTEDNGESGDDEQDEQNGELQAEPDNGERRPRRRGRRGGRRRRGAAGQDGENAEEGLAAAIADDLGPPAPPEAAEAAEDLNASLPVEPVAPTDENEPAETQAVEATPDVEPASDEAGKPRRRSTVREKVSFLFGGDTPDEQPPASPGIETPVVTPAQEPEPTSPTESAPRRSGWWSRRSGE
ncbi:MAG: Rne/Rng family ribonuclease [Afipia sp.]|nr:Rne/Rng family ribonuclease [Afipia sp.]OJW63891.1 MAG: ribonuclease [Afipia sp. 64-13]